MSSKELSRAEVMGRVKSGSLRLREAGELLELSYRQTQRLWARYRKGGAKALPHGNCGQSSHRSHPKPFRQAVLERVKSRYGDFGSTLAAEHLGEEDGLCVHAETLRRWMGRPGCGGERAGARPIGSGGNGKHILASWCSWTGAFMSGWKSAAGVVV